MVSFMLPQCIHNIIMETMCSGGYHYKGWYTYDVHFEGGGGSGKNEVLSDVGGGRLASVDLGHDQTSC